MTALIIGRHPDCDIVINDPTVSRRHAELSEAGVDLYMVADQTSTSGSYRLVDGGWQRFTSARLRGADKLRLGAFETTAADLMRQARPGSARPPAGSTLIERDPATGQIVVRPR